MKPIWERFEEEKYNKENFKMSQSIKRNIVLEIKKETKFLTNIGKTMGKFAILDQNEKKGIMKYMINDDKPPNIKTNPEFI